MGVSLDTKIIAGFCITDPSDELRSLFDWLMDGDLAFQNEKEFIFGMEISSQCKKLVDGNLNSLEELSPELFTKENLDKLKNEYINYVEKDILENSVELPEEFRELTSKEFKILYYVTFS